MRTWETRNTSDEETSFRRRFDHGGVGLHYQRLTWTLRGARVEVSFRCDRVEVSTTGSMLREKGVNSCAARNGLFRPHLMRRTSDDCSFCIGQQPLELGVDQLI